MKENKALIFIIAFIIIPIIFYAIYSFGRSEQRKIASRLDQSYIDNIKKETRVKTLRDIQSFLKTQGIDLILDDKK